MSLEEPSMPVTLPSCAGSCHSHYFITELSRSNMYIHWDLKMLRLYSDELAREHSVSSSTSTDLLSLVWIMDGKPNMQKEGTNTKFVFRTVF